jgi:signal transduction histidine kinase
MKIQNKLLLVYSCIFGVILLLFTLGIFVPYSKKIYEDFFDRLHLRGLAKVDLLDGGTVSTDILHEIYQNTPGNFEPHVTIYTSKGELVYKDKRVISESKHHYAVLHDVLTKHHIQWWSGKMQTDAFYIEGHKINYLVFVTGYDNFGVSHLNHLKWVLTIAYLLVMLIIIYTIHLFAAQAFKPVSSMIIKVKEITSSNLGIRLGEGNKKDELAQLAITFNRMLDQLEKAFSDQRHLVYSISHELRTPLASIIAELELSQDKEKTAQEYQKTINGALSDAKRLARLSTNLLDMAKAGYEPSEITMGAVRIDELLIEVAGKVQAMNQDYRVNLLFANEPEDESDVTIYGNNYLLGAAFVNLAENGCKYSSDKNCNAQLSFTKEAVIVKFSNKGIDILPEDRERIFMPFCRGQNRGNINGNGIGLPLAKKIVTLHKGSLDLISKDGETSFTVTLPTHQYINENNSI